MAQPDTFPLFPRLPKELRLQIWKSALPGPRIIYLQRHFLTPYETSRVWSNRDILSWTPTTVPSTTIWDSDASDDEFHPGRAIQPTGPAEHPKGFKSPSPAPEILLVCREAHEIVTRFYERTFGDRAAYPETWFNFAIDTLYLDWGWEGNGIAFRPLDFGVVAKRVKHLAVYHRGREFHHSRRADHEEWICEVLAQFCNLETLTLVDQRHKYKEIGDLVFMEPVRLAIWDRFYQFCRCEDVNLALLRAYRVKWEGGVEGALPAIGRKVITANETREALARIVGGIGKVGMLVGLDWDWAEAWSDRDVGGLMVDQQIEYLRLIITELKDRERDTKPVEMHIAALQSRIMKLEMSIKEG